MYIHIYVCVYIYVYIYVYTYIYVYIYIYISQERSHYSGLPGAEASEPKHFVPAIGRWRGHLFVWRRGGGSYRGFVLWHNFNLHKFLARVRWELAALGWRRRNRFLSPRGTFHRTASVVFRGGLSFPSRRPDHEYIGKWYSDLWRILKEPRWFSRECLEGLFQLNYKSCRVFTASTLGSIFGISSYYRVFLSSGFLIIGLSSVLFLLFWVCIMQIIVFE